MGCSDQIMGSGENVHFTCRKEEQKYFIEFILTHSNYDLKALAELLDINILLLSQVISGHAYLEEQVVIRLMDWYCILIGDSMSRVIKN